MSDTSSGRSGVLLVAVLLAPMVILLLMVVSVLVPIFGVTALANQGPVVCVGTPTATGVSAAPGTPSPPDLLTPSASSGSPAPLTASPQDASPTVLATPTPASCIDPNANAVVAWAMQAEPHLHNCGAKQLDECYDDGFPAPLIAWWQRTCPGCSQWQNGNLQCVMLAGAVFGVAGLPLFWGPNGEANGIDFWYNYAGYPGWREVASAYLPSGLTPATESARGLPAAGDLMIWYDEAAPRDGHAAIVVQVIAPTASAAGSVTFVEANGPGPLVVEALTPDLTVRTWTHYSVAGFIRYVGPHNGSPISTPAHGASG